MVYWHWILLGIMLVIYELYTPGFFIIWIGLGAVTTGITDYFMPDLSFTIDCLIFLVASVLFCFIGRIFYKKDEQPDNMLNRRTARYIGQSFEIIDDTQHGQGRVKIDDSVWSVRSDKDFKKGDFVRVVDVDGTTLKVE